MIINPTEQATEKQYVYLTSYAAEYLNDANEDRRNLATQIVNSPREAFTQQMIQDFVNVVAGWQDEDRYNAYMAERGLTHMIGRMKGNR